MEVYINNKDLEKMVKKVVKEEVEKILREHKLIPDQEEVSSTSILEVL